MLKWRIGESELTQDMNGERCVKAILLGTGRPKLSYNQEKICTTVKRGNEATEAVLETLVAILVSYYKATCRLPMGPGEASGDGNRLTESTYTGSKLRRSFYDYCAH
jgi:hypothetical protein